MTSAGIVHISVINQADIFFLKFCHLCLFLGQTPCAVQTRGSVSSVESSRESLCDTSYYVTFISWPSPSSDLHLLLCLSSVRGFLTTTVLALPYFTRWHVLLGTILSFTTIEINNKTIKIHHNEERRKHKSKNKTYILTVGWFSNSIFKV